MKGRRRKGGGRRGTAADSGCFIHRRCDLHVKQVTRTDIYRHGDARVDVKLRPDAWFAQVRVWNGARWPKVEKTWRARVKGWVPWFSLERQAVRAVEYANRRTSVYLSREEIRKRVQTALKLL